MGPIAATIVFAPSDFNCQEKSQGDAEHRVRNLNNDRLIFLSIYSHLSTAPVLLIGMNFCFAGAGIDDEINTHRQRSICSKNR
jgi:hypothetical protein